MPLVAFPTSGYNCYVSQADATAYLSLSVGADAWTSASSGQRDAALVSATRAIDKMSWLGEKTDPTQALAFPRTGLVDREGVELPDDEIPPDVISACIELALALLVDASLYTSSSTDKNIASIGAGSAQISYFRPTPGTGRFPPQVASLLGYLMEGGDGGSSSSPKMNSSDLDCLSSEISSQSGFSRRVL